MIINDESYTGKKRKVLYIKLNSSMIYNNLNNHEFIFTSGWEDKKYFIFDLIKNYFTICADNSYLKYKLFRSRKYLDKSIILIKIKIISKEQDLFLSDIILEKIYPKFQTQEISFFENIIIVLTPDIWLYLLLILY